MSIAIICITSCNSHWYTVNYFPFWIYLYVYSKQDSYFLNILEYCSNTCGSYAIIMFPDALRRFVVGDSLLLQRNSYINIVWLFDHDPLTLSKYFMHQKLGNGTGDIKWNPFGGNFAQKYCVRVCVCVCVVCTMKHDTKAKEMDRQKERKKERDRWMCVFVCIGCYVAGYICNTLLI